MNGKKVQNGNFIVLEGLNSWSRLSEDQEINNSGPIAFQKTTILIGSPLEFSEDLQMLRAKNKTHVSCKIEEFNMSARVKVFRILRLPQNAELGRL